MANEFWDWTPPANLLETGLSYKKFKLHEHASGFQSWADAVMGSLLNDKFLKYLWYILIGGWTVAFILRLNQWKGFRPASVFESYLFVIGGGLGITISELASNCYMNSGQDGPEWKQHRRI